MEKREFAFENEFVKIINPTKEVEKEIIEMLRQNKSGVNDGVSSAYYILNRLCIPKVEGYDFSKYSLEEFRKMVNEIHCYKGFQEIMNEAAIIGTEITIRELQYTMLGLKQQRLEVLLEIIKEDSEGLKELGKELYQAKKESEKMKEMASKYKEKRLIEREVNKLSLDEDVM